MQSWRAAALATARVAGVSLRAGATSTTAGVLGGAPRPAQANAGHAAKMAKARALPCRPMHEERASAPEYSRARYWLVAAGSAEDSRASVAQSRRKKSGMRHKAAPRTKPAMAP